MCVAFGSLFVRMTFLSKCLLFLLHFFSRKYDKNSRGLSWKITTTPPRKNFISNSGQQECSRYENTFSSSILSFLPNYFTSLENKVTVWGSKWGFLVNLGSQLIVTVQWGCQGLVGGSQGLQNQSGPHWPLSQRRKGDRTTLVCYRGKKRASKHQSSPGKHPGETPKSGSLSGCRFEHHENYMIQGYF